jgi:hypothetical protein
MDRSSRAPLSMPSWQEFLERYPRPHVLVGWARGGRRWRSDSLLQWIAVQELSGMYSFKRDYESKGGRYVILIALEKEADAVRLGRLLNAERVFNAGVFATRHEFKLPWSQI